MELLERLQNTVIALWVAGSDWGYPIVLTLHSIGMALVVGIVFMVSIRVMGYPRGLPLAELDRFIPILWLGVAGNLVSGALLFAANATGFVTNPAFQIKILLIILGTFAAWLVDRAITRQRADSAGSMPSTAKVYAATSIVIWTSVIVAGRVIAYVD